MKHVVIPKKIKSKEKGLILYLKTDITGTYFDDNIQEFICNRPNCTFHIEAETTSEVVHKVREKIIETYLKGINNFDSLNSSEMNLFHYIKNVRSCKLYKNNTLIIGYADNYIIDIQNTTLKFNTLYDHIVLPKNIELYIGKTYDIMYDNIIDKIKKKNYNKFIIDITNVFMDSNYEKTKKIIEYIESENGDILFLLEHSLIAKHRFLKIFGDKYENNVLFKDDYIHGSKVILRQIKNILSYN